MHQKHNSWTVNRFLAETITSVVINNSTEHFDTAEANALWIVLTFVHRVTKSGLNQLISISLMCVNRSLSLFLTFRLLSVQSHWDLSWLSEKVGKVWEEKKKKKKKLLSLWRLSRHTTFNGRLPALDFKTKCQYWTCSHGRQYYRINTLKSNQTRGSLVYSDLKTRRQSRNVKNAKRQDELLQGNGMKNIKQANSKKKIGKVMQ